MKEEWLNHLLTVSVRSSATFWNLRSDRSCKWSRRIWGSISMARANAKARGKKHKVAWIDGKGNTHDLDYVFETAGDADHIGTPRAFIEIAWRRYTKHSRNKAQEIQGAILPLAERYSDAHPFLGVVLGGVFTEGSLNQLRSHGFTVLYFPYKSVIGAFAFAGIDAAFDEDTPDSQLLRKVKQYQKLSAAKKRMRRKFTS